MLVIDLLLGNLLYGHPITQSLTADLMVKLKVTCYVTDIAGEDHAVLLCIMAGQDNSELTAYLKQRFNATYAEPFDLCAGRVVDAIDQIHLSYADCLGKRADAEGETAIQVSQAQESSAKQQILTLRDNVLAYLQANFTDSDFSQSQVADRFGISIYTLSRLFRNHVGIGYSEYVTGKRLHHGKDPLLTTSLPVSAIAEQSGILNVNYFSRLFRLNFRVTPMKYGAEAGSTSAG